jgi:putative copper export protein
VLPELIDSAEPPSALIAGVARRFSRIAGLAVGIVAVTAFYNGLIYVGSIAALWKSAYGLTVIAKIALFIFLVNLGAFNRYVSVPLLQEWAGASPESRGVFTRLAVRLFPGFTLEGSGRRVALRFKRLVRGEAFLIVLVLLCAALLRHEIPARHLSHVGHVHTDGAPMHMDGGGTMHNHAGQHNQ